MPKLLLVGCGRMGQAMANGWLKEGLIKIKDLMIVDPFPLPAALCEARYFSDSADIPSEENIDLIILAIKPQMVDDVIPAYSRFSHQTAFISVLAGTSIKTIQTALKNPKAKIVRTMPNTPASIGRGITALYAKHGVIEEYRELCERLFKVLGRVVWVEKEDQMHTVTAISGSGPGYVFQFIEDFIKAAQEFDLDPILAKELAVETCKGAIHLLEESGDDPSKLRENVTSPKGTTEAGLKVLRDEYQLQSLLKRTIAAAYKRSAELS